VTDSSRQPLGWIWAMVSANVNKVETIVRLFA
jgi:hypothetical protein